MRTSSDADYLPEVLAESTAARRISGSAGEYSRAFVERRVRVEGWSGIAAVAHVLFGLALFAAAEPDDPFPFSYAACPSGSPALRFFRVSYDDEPRFADPAFDDSAWAQGDALSLQPPAGWNGRAWFRSRVVLPEHLSGIPVGIFGMHRGAMEIYVDGKLIQRLGDPSNNTLADTPGSLGTAVGAFTGGKEHAFAIRYGVPPVVGGQDEDFAFAVQLCDVVSGNSVVRARRERLTLTAALFVGFAGALGILHLFLFFFLRKDPGHLEYAVFTTSVAVLTATTFFRDFDLTMLTYRLSLIVFLFAMVVLSASGVRFFSRLAGEIRHPAARLMTWAAVPQILALPWMSIAIAYAYCAIGLAFMLFFAFRAVRMRPRELAIVVVGLALALATSFIKKAPELLGLPYNFETLYIYGFSALLLSMSIYLARDVAVLQELKDTRAQLIQSEKMAALGQLVAGVAHEINTPIGAIGSMHDSMARAVGKLREVLSPETQQEKKVAASMKVLEDGASVIKTGADRVSRIVQRLKSFARLDEAELQNADLHEGLEDTLVLLDHEFKGYVTVVRDYGELPAVRCHPGQLNQVFMNLLMNARQAIEGKGTITIRTRVEGADAVVAIKDSGVGIPEENLKRIFDPGFTTKGSRVGTGLGLAICYRIIEAHKGRIEVKNRVGEGAEFVVRVPVAGG